MVHYRISELADAVGLSRSTLLYYEKLELIRGHRQPNGYRVYAEKDLQRLRLLLKLQAGGLTLKECQACLDAKIDRPLLQQRLATLDEEIARKQASRTLLAALLGEGDLRQWHSSVDSIAPEAHLDWLINQGFSRKEAQRLKWLSKDMNEHQSYMADFMKVFEVLDRWGPGSEADSNKALAAVPYQAENILEIGCGKGLTTLLLARQTQAHITSLDNEETALEHLRQLAADNGLEGRITTVCADMAAMPFEAESFDLLWAESSAYLMGVEQALKHWRPLLRDEGVLVLSDLVWLTDTPSPTNQAFWQQEYPGMTQAKRRIQQAQSAGYQLLASFAISEAAWLAYYEPLQARVNELRPGMPDSPALQAIQGEIDAFHNGQGEFGYQFLVLQK